MSKIDLNEKRFSIKDLVIVILVVGIGMVAPFYWDAGSISDGDEVRKSSYGLGETVGAFLVLGAGNWIRKHYFPKEEKGD